MVSSNHFVHPCLLADMTAPSVSIWRVQNSAAALSKSGHTLHQAGVNHMVLCVSFLEHLSHGFRMRHRSIGGDSDRHHWLQSPKGGKVNIVSEKLYFLYIN